MIRYYKTVKDGVLTSIGTGQDGTEITKEEYDRLLTEIIEKEKLVEKLMNDEITPDSIKAEWRNELVQRVEKRKIIAAKAMK